MTVEITTDDRGQLRGFPYHDGYLEGVLLEDRGETAILPLRSSSGDRYEIRLHDVIWLQVDDLRQGNIIMDILYRPSDIASADALVAKQLKSRLYIAPDKLPPASFIFQLIPSYGADVLAVCADIEVAVRKNPASAP